MKTIVPAVAFAGPAGCADAAGPMTRLATIARTPTRASSEVLRMYVLHLSRCSSESESCVRCGEGESGVEHVSHRGQPAPAARRALYRRKLGARIALVIVVAGIASLMTATARVC